MAKLVDLDVRTITSKKFNVFLNRLINNATIILAFSDLFKKYIYVKDTNKDFYSIDSDNEICYVWNRRK